MDIKETWPGLIPVLLKMSSYLAWLQTQELCPSYTDLFKAFELTPQYSVKVVILGIEPPPSKEASGLAYQRKNLTISPALRIVLNTLRKLDLIQTRPSKVDLSKWAEQGVLLMNLYPSTVEHYVAVHRSKEWEEFYKEVFYMLPDDVVILAWGNECIEAAKHYKRGLVLTECHPLAEVYARKTFSNSTCFIDANNYLISKNLKPIQWDTCLQTT